ncbi:uncharacterized protein RHO17_004572 [Thomomys bottae]
MELVDKCSLAGQTTSRLLTPATAAAPQIPEATSIIHLRTKKCQASDTVVFQPGPTFWASPGVPVFSNVRSVAAGVSVAQETTEKVADGIRQKRNLKGPQEEEGYNVYEVDCWLMVPLDACSSHTEKWTTQGDCVSGRSVNGTTVVWPVVRGMVSAVESASAEMLSRPWHTWQLGANGGKEQRCQMEEEWLKGWGYLTSLAFPFVMQPQSELHQPAIKGMMSLQQQTLLQSRGCLDTGSTSCRPDV